MKNNVIKLMVCAGIFCGTNFGMEKEWAVSRVVQRNIYVERNGDFQSINQDGSYSKVEDSIESIIKSSERFKDSYLFLDSKNRCYVEGRGFYGLKVALKKEGRIENLPLEDFDSVPLKWTNTQLIEVARLIDVRNGFVDVWDKKDGKLCKQDGKQYNIFILDEFNFRLDIESCAFDIELIVNQLKDDIAKEKADSSESQKK